MKHLLLIAALLTANPAWALTPAESADIASVNLIQNGGLERGITGYAAFKDPASSIPDDLTGHTSTPATKCERSTADPLDGSASLLVTFPASNAQGEGCSVSFNVQPAYQGRNVTLSFPLQIVSGSMVAGDVEMWVYNVTKSTRQKAYCPSFGAPTVQCTFPTDARDTTPVNHAYRLAFYRPVTTATALVLKADNFKVSPESSPMGMAGSNEQSYTLTIGGSTSAPTQGSGATKAATYSRVGDKMRITFTYSQSAAGSTGTGTYLFPLPSPYKIDTSKVAVGTGAIGSGNTVLGHGQASTTTAINTTTSAPLNVYGYDSSNLYLVSMVGAGSAAGQAQTVGSSAFSLANTTQYYTFTATVPISGWDANVSMGESSTFRISSYLANGVRVTGSTPTKLGEYRSYLRNAAGIAYTETNGAPTDAPSSANGIRIYRGNAFSGADTNNNPTRYEIFVGKGKFIKVEWYSSAGKTGVIDTTPALFDSSTNVGYYQSYDPTTGIVTITAARTLGGSATHFSGVTADGQSTTNNPYFDIVVSENPQFVGAGSLRSEIRMAGFNAYATATSTVRANTLSFSNGTAFSRTDSSSDSYVETLEDGLYQCQMKAQAATAGGLWVIDKNTAAGSLAGQQSDDLLASIDGVNTANWRNNLVSPARYLPAGTKIRFKCSSCGTLADAIFHCTKVAH